MQSIQIALRYVVTDRLAVEKILKADPCSEKFAPELDFHECPPVMALKSVHNTTIEGLWHWLREKIGHDIKAHLLRGQEGHHYSVAVAWHR